MGLDVNALKDFETNKLFPADKYEAEIVKVTVKKDGDELESVNVIVRITNYAGTKKGGAGAIGEEFGAYIGNSAKTDSDYLKKKYDTLGKTLVVATEIQTNDDFSEEFLKGKIVHIALDVGKDKWKKDANQIAFFEHP